MFLLLALWWSWIYQCIYKSVPSLTILAFCFSVLVFGFRSDLIWTGRVVYVTRLNSTDNIICCITSLKLLRSAPTAQREWRDFIDS